MWPVYIALLVSLYMVFHAKYDGGFEILIKAKTYMHYVI